MDASSEASTYKYHTLPDNHIRILTLTNEEDIFEISVESLDRKIEGYHALSWTWSHENLTETIRVKVKDDDAHRLYDIKVKPYLLKALRRLRQPDTGVLRLWIDAICINQAEDREAEQEKSRQVPMMTRIYGMAQRVCVWLGEEDEYSATAIQYIDEFVKLDDKEHITALEHKNPDPWRLLCILKFLKRDWFGRRWVVQEIAMARHARVYCGKDYVEWTKLADAVALFEKVGRDGTINRILEKLLRKGDSTEYDIEYRCRISSLPAYRLVQNTTGMFRGQDKRGVRTWRYTLEELVCFLAAFEASRPHDTIYAVLGLASDIRPATASEEHSIYTKNLGPRANRPRQNIKGFNVDYEVPPLVVFKTFMKHVIETSGSLDIICRPWAPDKVRDTEGNYQPIDLPSWIPSISKKPFQRTQKGNMMRRNPNPLVGAKSFRHKFYNASGSRKVIWSENMITDESNLMTVKGFKLGEIKEIWPNNTTGNVPAEWLTAGGWDSDMEYPPEDLWRTLVADRNRQGGDAERWYPMALQSVVQGDEFPRTLDTHTLINRKGNTAVAELFRRIRAVVWGRSLIRVEGGFMSWLAGESSEGESSEGEEGKSRALGLAPGHVEGAEGARENDIICIIFGCSVPLVLRDDGSSMEPDNKTYTLIGECYVDHMMDGEAIAYLEDKEGLMEEEFKLK